MKSNSLGYLFTVIVDNFFEGRQFILRDDAEIREFGISPHSVRNAISTDAPLFGMRVERANIHITKTDPYDDIKEQLHKNKHYFSTRVSPLLGRVIDNGPYQNLEFSIYGTREAERYFTKTGVLETARGRQSSYRGCTFQHVSHRVAIPAHGNMTQEIADYLEQKYTKR